MYTYLSNICQFMWLLITDKCRIINILPRMPEMRDTQYGLLHNDNIFIDYNRERYIKSDIVVPLLIQSQVQAQVQEENNTIFKKLRDNSNIKKFMPKGSYTTTCGVCIEKMKRNDIVRELSCHHTFHINCIDQWFEKKCCCPFCNITY